MATARSRGGPAQRSGSGRPSTNRAAEWMAEADDMTTNSDVYENDSQAGVIKAHALTVKDGVGLLDGVDLHGKWPRGGGGAPTTFEHYLSEVPLRDHKIHTTWRERLSELRNVTVSLGRPDFMLMNNGLTSSAKVVTIISTLGESLRSPSASFSPF